MRELVIEKQEVLIIPTNYKLANKGTVTSVSANEFTLDLEYSPEGLLVNNYCEFYTQTKHGKLYFNSYIKKINDNTLTVASPSKHKFLQRRQYTRVKYVKTVDLNFEQNKFSVQTHDISAGGLKCQTIHPLNIDKIYNIQLPLNDKVSISCEFQPIRIERNSETEYIVSGQFIYKNTNDRMLLNQYCTKRKIEIQNK